MTQLSPQPGGNEAEGDFTEAQLAEAERLKQEVPRIDAALKNFLSMKMAEGLTGADAVEAEAGAGAPLDQQAAMGCARTVLKALNALELPPAPAWGQLHPQAEDERGVDFMDRLAKYKVVQALWQRCRAAGQKPAKLLGRSALRFAFPELQPALAEAAAGTGVAEELLRAFAEEFGRSLDAAPAAGSASDLVWAADLRVALAERQRARQAEAAEREQRAASAEDFAAELRAAVASQGLPGLGSSSVQVEELPE